MLRSDTACPTKHELLIKDLVYNILLMKDVEFMKNELLKKRLNEPNEYIKNELLRKGWIYDEWLLK